LTGGGSALDYYRDYLLQIVFAVALLAIFYMYAYWPVALFVVFLVGVIVIAYRQSKKSPRGR
jgi:hypothetical protein